MAPPQPTKAPPPPSRPPPILSPRPCPPNPREQQRVLHSIYQAIDSHNYAKVLKLTSSSTSSDRWDIVRALRIHALERIGKVREALMLLWELVVEDVVVAGAVGATSVASSTTRQYEQRQVWSELYQRIQALTTIEDIVIHEGHSSLSSSSTNRGERASHSHHHRSLNDVQLLDAVRRLDALSFAPIVDPFHAANNDGSKNGATPPATTKSSVKGSKETAKKSSSSDNYSISYYYHPVTDETVLQTLSVTLRNCKLYASMSEMYYQATTALSSSSSASSISTTTTSLSTAEDVEQQEENYRNVLEEGVCVHLRAVCDCTSIYVDSSSDCISCSAGRGDDKAETNNTDWSQIFSLQSQLPKLQSLLNMSRYYERMQTSSLQLAKVTAQPLHFQWTAISSLWYKESLERLASTLEYVQCLISSSHENDDNCKVGDQEGDDDLHAMLTLLVRRILYMLGLVDSSEIASRITTLRRKVALLPRLAESLSSRMVFSSQHTSLSSSGGNGGGGGTSDSSSAAVVVSENDWDVYLESLLVQGKKSEALEVLKNIQCTPMIGDGGNDLHPTKTADGEDSRVHEISDEETILNHVGSMLRYTQRKKLERLAKLSHELGMFENAEGYYRELLRAFPDDWTYWKGLVETSCERIYPKSSLASVSTRMGTSSDREEKIVSIDKAGWQRCHSFAKEIATTVGTKERHILRGPHLILLELASLELRQTPSQSPTTDEINQRARMFTLLHDEICEYGNKFGLQASCCFADMRSYIHVLVHASTSGEEIAEMSIIPNDILHLLKWANGIWDKNTQSTVIDQINGGASMEDESRERRKKLRSFIFASQIVYSIASEMKDLTLHLLETFAPSVSQMVSEWKISLVCLPSVAAKDGGQKEVLPGDEIVLLISQYLLFRASLQPLSSRESATTLLLQSAGLLEDAMDHSPHNPHLKIAAISIYAKLNAASRALTIFQDMGVKQIQLDSCSYLILPLLIRGGLYTSAIKLSASILRLHGSTSQDVKTYSSKALQNGLVFKAKEMVEFQCGKMRQSLQLLYSKGLLLDTAPMMISSDLENDSIAEAKQKNKSNPARLAAEKGFCGREVDVMRAEQLAIDAETHFNAPAIIHAPAQSTTVDKFVCSDNRDMTVNYFEILCHTTHWTEMEMVTESLRRGHVHGLVARAIMAVEVANAPKKGKVSKPTEETSYRCQSLRYALKRATEFGRGVKLDELDTVLWESCCHLCEVIIVVIYGSTSEDSRCTTLEERDVLATSIIHSMTQLVQSAREALNSCNSEVNTSEQKSFMGGRVCQLLPDYICPLFILLETTSRLFSLFGWGKRKRLTKAASGALALAALSLQDLISDMLNIIAQFRSVSTHIQSLIESSTSPEFGQDTLQRVVREVVSSRELTKDRVDPFLVQMRERLQSYSEGHNEHIFAIVAERFCV